MNKEMNKNEIYETLWGYENPQKKLKLSLDVINDADDNTKYNYQIYGDLRKNIKHSIKVMMMDGTSFIQKVNLDNRRGIIIKVIDMIKRKTGLTDAYGFKFFTKGEENECCFFELMDNKEPFNIFALPYLLPVFQVGMKCEKWGHTYHYDDRVEERNVKIIYEIVRMTKSNLWVDKRTYSLVNGDWIGRFQNNDFASSIRCKYKNEIRFGQNLQYIKTGIQHNKWSDGWTM